MFYSNLIYYYIWLKFKFDINLLLRIFFILFFKIIYFTEPDDLSNYDYDDTEELCLKNKGNVNEEEEEKNHNNDQDPGTSVLELEDWWPAY